MKYCLCKVKKIYRNCTEIGGIRVELDNGIITKVFPRPKQGLHLKKGDLVILHSEYGNSRAIDKVVAIDGHYIKIRRVLGKFNEAPALKKKEQMISVWLI